MLNDFTFIKNNKDFHQFRATHLGASDLVIICGLSKYTTPHKLFLLKTGRLLPDDMGDPAKWGHRLEMPVLSSYIEETRNEEIAYQFELDYLKHKNLRRKNYKPATEFFPFTRFIHSEVKWASAHPDCLNINNEYLIQAKSHKKFVYDYESIPIPEYIQCQWEMFCSGANENILRALVNTNEIFQFNITANKKLQEKLIDLASRFFWHVKNDKEPAPINSDDIKKIFPQVQVKSSYLTDIESEYAGKMIDRRKFLKKKIGKYNNEVKDINDGLMLLARDNKLLYNSEGEKLCSQVMYEKESLSIKDLPENIYKKLKEDGIIKTNQVRYIS